ncbi:hypothetical protein [Microbispora sitophila]|uniref:hypothetical protein n=1 Tax=Microbispora sitophila TaxID=2771537 RepID=UPI001D00B93A|nr:hypothetical protein [Microbispora sitophila]
MTRSRTYELSMTTQGPLYPPSEVMNADGHFVVIGGINRARPGGGVVTEWGGAIVAPDSELPPFGQNAPYRIVRELPADLSDADRAMVLHTLPLPLPCNNYPMVFAPEQLPEPLSVVRPSYPFHQVPIPDLQPEDGPKVLEPITLGQWVKAAGVLTISLVEGDTAADFHGEFTGLIPNTLYTVMAIRARDMRPDGRAHPSPLGVPNVLMADQKGEASYHARLPNPFPAPGTAQAQNRIVNVVLLWMSYQQNYGGAIGRFGLGGDVHAQLKLARPGFAEFTTHA